MVVARPVTSTGRAGSIETQTREGKTMKRFLYVDGSGRGFSSEWTEREIRDDLSRGDDSTFADFNRETYDDGEPFDGETLGEWLDRCDAGAEYHLDAAHLVCVADDGTVDAAVRPAGMTGADLELMGKAATVIRSVIGQDFRWEPAGARQYGRHSMMLLIHEPGDALRPYCDLECGDARKVGALADALRAIGLYTEDCTGDYSGLYPATPLVIPPGK